MSVHKYLLLLMPLLLTGCQNAYYAERSYWYANKQYGATYKNYQTVPDKEFKEAVTALEGVVAAYPAWNSSADIQFAIGNMYAGRKDYDAALDAYKKVYMNFPQSYELCARAIFATGLVYEQRGDFKEALTHYNEVQDKYAGTKTGLQVPLYLTWYYHSKNLNEEKDKAYALAMRHYNNLIEQNPYAKQVPAYQYLIITLCGNEGKWNDAITSLGKFVDKYPKTDAAPSALYRMSLIYRDVLKKPDEALAVCQRIVTEYPKSSLNKNAQFEIGNLSILQGRMDLAREEFNQALEKYPDDGAFGAAAQIAIAGGYDKEGHWDEAEPEYRKVMGSYPHSTEALTVPLIIVHHFEQAGDSPATQKAYNDAIRYYTGILTKNTDKKFEAAAAECLANAYTMQQKWTQAIAALQIIRERYPNDPRAAAALLRQGLVLQQGLHDAEKAKEIFMQFIQEYPNNPMANSVQELLKKMTV